MLARAGLLRRARGRRRRPPLHQRRRALALATSTGLTAPLLALDGLPHAMAAPSPVPWDELAAGSVTMAAEAITPLEQLAPALLAPLGDDEQLLRRATPWVRAAGIDGSGTVAADDVRAAADELGVVIGPRVDATAVRAVRQGVIQQARPVVTALGLTGADDVVEARDVRAAARALQVPVPEGVTPDLVRTVLDEGDQVVTDHLDATVTPYAEALGLDIGDRPDAGDTRAVAAELGLELPDVPDAAAAEQLHRAWLNTLRPYFSRIGVDPGGRVDPVDLVALGRALGADVDAGVGPAEVSDLLAELDAPDFVPPAFGSIDGVTLHLPSRDVLLAGWHEAAGPSALPMDPAATGVATQLPSRGRPHDPHSALDVAVRPGTQALAPVTGTVVEVSPYMLYGVHPDTRVVIRPDGAPHLAVSVLHVTGPLVEVGTHVTAGNPVAAHATEFPFLSQIEDQTGRAPHIHLEVKAAP